MNYFNVITNAQTGQVTQVPFTEEETVAYEAVVAEYARTAYITQRAAEYPPMADYLDGVVKGDQQQIDAYIAACKAVKEKYPKLEQTV